MNTGMRVVYVIFRLFTDWQFWVVAIFLIALYSLVSRITALDKKPAAVYVRLSSTPAQSKSPAGKAGSEKTSEAKKEKSRQTKEAAEAETDSKKGAQ